MGLISAAKAAVQDVFAESWRDYFICNDLDNETLMLEGKKKVGGKSSNKKGNDNIISNGSIIAVHEKQCMIIVDQGAIVELCAEPGEFIYDNSTEPSFFYGGLGKSIVDSLKTMGRRISFGGDAAREQRVYFINLHPITGNKFGTSEPIPFTLIEPTYKVAMEFKLRCNGEYQFEITDPLAFYRFAGNVEEFPTSRIVNDFRSPFMGGLGGAISNLTMQGISYTAIRSHDAELTEAMNQTLANFTQEKGITIRHIFINSLSMPEELQKQYDAIQFNKIRSVDPNQLMADQVMGSVEALKAAASNENGAVNGFLGMGMAMNQMNGMGMNPMAAMGGMGSMQPNAMMQQNMMQQNQMQQQMMQQNQMQANPVMQQNMMQQNAAPVAPVAPAAPVTPAAPAADSWKCSCGEVCTTKFCMKCGAKKPEPAEEEGWKCGCGTVNKGNFCPDCGARRPAGAPLYRCDKCGWEPADPKNPPKFCPECGDPFTDDDVKA